MFLIVHTLCFWIHRGKCDSVPITMHTLSCEHCHCNRSLLDGVKIRMLRVFFSDLITMVLHTLNKTHQHIHSMCRRGKMQLVIVSFCENITQSAVVSRVRILCCADFQCILKTCSYTVVCIYSIQLDC